MESPAHAATSNDAMARAPQNTKAQAPRCTGRGAGVPNLRIPPATTLERLKTPRLSGVRGTGVPNPPPAATLERPKTPRLSGGHVHHKGNDVADELANLGRAMPVPCTDYHSPLCGEERVHVRSLNISHLIGVRVAHRMLENSNARQRRWDFRSVVLSDFPLLDLLVTGYIG